MIRIVAVLLLMTACEERKASTPEEAYALFARAVREDDARGVFDSLDLLSRWSVMSIHKSERDIHRLAATRYSSGPREREMARYQVAAESDDAAAFFAREFSARLATLKPKLPARAEVERGPDGKTATLRTEGGGHISFARGDDGRWGWADLREELQARERWSANALQMVREGADPRGK